MKVEGKRGSYSERSPTKSKNNGMETVYQNLRGEGSLKVKLYISPDTIFKYTKTSKINCNQNRGTQNILVQTIKTYGGENEKKMTHTVVIDKPHKLTNEINQGK